MSRSSQRAGGLVRQSRLRWSREPRPSGEAPRLQPLWGALIVTALWWAGLRVLEQVLLPGPWQSRALLIAAAVLLVTGGGRALWPKRPVLPCLLALAVGSAILAVQVLTSPALSAWTASPASELAAVGQQVRATDPPMPVSDSLSLVLAALTLLIAWWCALISTTGGDRVGVTAVVPASSMLVVGLLTDWTPPGRMVLGFAAGILLLIGSAVPVMPAVRGGLAGLRARLGLAGTRIAVLILALVLAAGVGGGMPVRGQDGFLDRIVGREKSVPETSLTLGSDLVHGSGTAFSYQAEGSEGGESLRFTLAVVRDLDGSTWDPISIPDNARTVSEPPTGLDGAALTPISALEASGGQAGSGADVPGLRAVVMRVDDLVTDRLPTLQSTLVVDSADDEVTGSWGGTALVPASWRWIPGTSTARSWRDTTASGEMYRAYGWSAVAGLDGQPMIAPPYPAPAPAAEELAPYLALPAGVSRGDAGGSSAIHEAGAQALAAAGLDPSSPAPARAAALAAWFHGNGFVYDESAPGSFDGAGAGGGSASPVGTVEAFLTERSGYCIHYSAAFTLMARDMGLPTRIAIGYASHSPAPGQNAGQTQVRAEDLHAWPEVWIDGAGWVAFEPTPGGAGARANKATPAEATPAPTTTPSPEPSASATAGPTPSAAAPTAGDADQSAGDSEKGEDPGEGGPAAGLGGLATGGATLGALAALAVVGAPALARVVRRRRRTAVMRGGGRGGDGPAEAAWAELLDCAVDLGLIGQGTPLPSRTPGAVVARLAEALGAGASAAGESLGALESAVVRERYSADIEKDGDGVGSGAAERGLEEALGSCVRAMREQAGWLRRLRATLLPTSLLRPLRI